MRHFLEEALTGHFLHHKVAQEEQDTVHSLLEQAYSGSKIILPLILHICINDLCHCSLGGGGAQVHNLVKIGAHD